mgnify:CR=1 FL=1
MLYNNIDIHGFLFYLTNSSADNVICNLNDGYIHESGIPGGVRYCNQDCLNEILCHVNKGDCLCWCTCVSQNPRVDINDYSPNRWCHANYYAHEDFYPEPL